MNQLEMNLLRRKLDENKKKLEITLKENSELRKENAMLHSAVKEDDATKTRLLEKIDRMEMMYENTGSMMNRSHQRDRIIRLEEEVERLENLVKTLENINQELRKRPNEDIRWCIEGSIKRPCWNCGKDTYNVSLAFETPMCSEECDNVKYREYEEELKKIEASEKEEK